MSFDLGNEINEKEKKTEGKKIGSLVTFHDIGLNHNSFKEFFKNEYNVQFYDKFVVYHIDAPGQQQGAEKLSSEYQFPSLPKMGEMLGPVLEHFQLTDVIGLGIGAGASVLVHAAMSFPEKFLGIVLVDPAAKSAGFKEWGEEKLAAWQLERKGFTSTSEKFLIWHLFGTKSKKNVNMELVDTYIKDITNNQNPHNLAQFVKAFMSRPDVTNEVHDKLKCQVLVITSAHSTYKVEANYFHTKLDRQKSSILESLDSINVFVEEPGKCGEGMLLLMQGCGLVPTLRTRTASRGGPVHRTSSMNEGEQ
ncbi:protein NDRG1-like isoform X2 [Hydractinia symbiolongicarpus]|uniref:protein NDRG1-like isoform X2 n=1 Tax=Hydractinia symbiolongicarpus TaxID=13093 RepID=UPI0025516786|nr:protein NDRG1-like isoform X2 [Hydractinia symbiolongicarpus]